MDEKKINQQEEERDDIQQDEKMKIIGRLAGGIAHDFNNILTAIIGNAELESDVFLCFQKIQVLINSVRVKAQEIGFSLDGIDEMQLIVEDISSQFHDYNNEILKAGHKAAELTNQLLVYSRKQKLKFENMVMDEEIINMYEMLGRIIRENIEIHFQTRAKSKTINGDKNQFMRVVLNLVGNASDAMLDGGELHIVTEEVSLKEEDVSQNSDRRIGQFIKLSVEDSGEGIAPQDLNKVFEPFYTTKHQGKGTGLGLATTQLLVEQHNGWIEIDSEVGKGTRFDVYFPCVKSKRIKAKIGESESIEKLKGDYTILIIEDEPALIGILKRVLKGNGCEVHIAESVQKGFEIYKEHCEEIDLIFSDHITPGAMNGAQLAEEIFQINPDQKILLTSGYIDEDVRLKIENIKTPFLKKPYGVHRLILKMKEILGD